MGCRMVRDHEVRIGVRFREPFLSEVLIDRLYDLPIQGRIFRGCAFSPPVCTIPGEVSALVIVDGDARGTGTQQHETEAGKPSFPRSCHLNTSPLSGGWSLMLAGSERLRNASPVKFLSLWILPGSLAAAPSETAFYWWTGILSWNVMF